MKDELTEMFGRKVDLVNKKNIERSRNYLRKNNIKRSLDRTFLSINVIIA